MHIAAMHLASSRHAWLQQGVVSIDPEERHQHTVIAAHGNKAARQDLHGDVSKSGLQPILRHTMAQRSMLLQCPVLDEIVGSCLRIPACMLSALSPRTRASVQISDEAVANHC